MANKERLAHYSPEDVSVTLAGLVNLTGFVEGTFINISRPVALFQSYETADGVVSRSRRPSKTYDVSITLMSTSESNEVLSRLSSLDHTFYSLKFPLLIKDGLGDTLFFAGTAWIEKPPEIVFDVGINGRVWTIKCTEASQYVGGNQGASSGSEDIFNALVGYIPSVN